LFKNKHKIENLTDEALNLYLHNSLWWDMRPKNFKRLTHKKIHTYRAIYNTVDGLLIPILITTGAMNEYKILD
jgi:glyoxylate utilization-related uncharacterized protein